MKSMVDALRITEIFHSLQGEARTVGVPTVFVRLTGCPLRCHYCDSAYAFEGGERISREEILYTVAEYQTPYVCVTGGEPLAQPGVLTLLADLADTGYQVSLETSGALPIGDVDHRISIVLDLKTPGSGECHRNLYDNLPLLQKKDQVKFVLTDQVDYQWARFKLDEYDLARRAGEVLMSPSFGELSAADLAEWILADRLPVRLQIQLHKLLWGDRPGV